ncbi:hypothetical protein BaRGS_00039320, partial [Batillaria attramentaria]
HCSPFSFCKCSVSQSTLPPILLLQVFSLPEYTATHSPSASVQSPRVHCHPFSLCKCSVSQSTLPPILLLPPILPLQVFSLPEYTATHSPSASVQSPGVHCHPFSFCKCSASRSTLPPILLLQVFSLPEYTATHSPSASVQPPRVHCHPFSLCKCSVSQSTLPPILPLQVFSLPEYTATHSESISVSQYAAAHSHSVSQKYPAAQCFPEVSCSPVFPRSTVGPILQVFHFPRNPYSPFPFCVFISFPDVQCDPFCKCFTVPEVYFAVRANSHSASVSVSQTYNGTHSVSVLGSQKDPTAYSHSVAVSVSQKYAVAIVF